MDAPTITAGRAKAGLRAGEARPSRTAMGTPMAAGIIVLVALGLLIALRFGFAGALGD